MKEELVTFLMGVAVGVMLMGAAWFTDYNTKLADACKQKGGAIVTGQCYKLEAIK